jgi:Putative zinc-finger
MICSEIQLKISECLDGDVHASEESSFQEHLSRCKGCRQIYEDLKFIKETAAELEEHEPAVSVWSAISSQLAAEGIVKKRRTSFWERVFPGSHSSWLKPALAGAILALITVGTVYFVRNSGREMRSFSPEAAVLLEVQKAELHYQKAIEALGEVSQKRLQSFRPELAQIFTDNLATMDYYLKECRDAVKNNPHNPLVHRYLLVAYEKKAELMQTIVNSDSQ